MGPLVAAGEDRYAPPIFQVIRRDLLRNDTGRRGGVGLKLHPDYRYCNLCHWLLGDTHLVRGRSGYPLPMGGHEYFNGPGDPRVA